MGLKWDSKFDIIDNRPWYKDIYLLCIPALSTSLTFWPTDRRTDWLTDQPTNQPTDQLTNQQPDQPTNQPTNQSIDRSTNQPTDWPTDRSTDGPTDQPTNQPIDRPTDRPTNRQTDYGTYIRLVLVQIGTMFVSSFVLTNFSVLSAQFNSSFLQFAAYIRLLVSAWITDFAEININGRNTCRPGVFI